MEQKTRKKEKED
jgi:hypothetical protein